jgi:hypothetical protein
LDLKVVTTHDLHHVTSTSGIRSTAATKRRASALLKRFPALSRRQLRANIVCHYQIFFATSFYSVIGAAVVGPPVKGIPCPA